MRRELLHDGGEIPERERGRGILSSSDREYLKNSDSWREQHSRSAEAQRRKAIKSRMWDAIHDFRPLTDDVEPETLQDVFGADDIGNPPVQEAMPYAFAFLIRAVLANENEREIERKTDVVAAVDPVLDQFEAGLRYWLNGDKGVAANVDVSIEASNVRQTDEYVDELRERSVVGRERIQAATQLSQAGYSTDEIYSILGDDPLSEEKSK